MNLLQMKEDMINISQYNTIENRNNENNPQENHSRNISEKIANVDDTQPEKEEKTV